MSFLNVNIPAQPTSAKPPETAPATEKPTTPIPAAPAADSGKPTPAPAPATDTADDTDIGFGLGLDDESDDGTSGATPAADEAPKPEPGSQYDTDDYTYTPPEGQALTPEGEERIASFAEFAHQANMPPESFETSIQFYNDLVAKELAKRAENDKASRGQLVQTLRNEWGQTYDANKAVLDQGFASLPQSLRTAIKQARLPDGRPLSFLPELAQLMHSIGRRSIAVPRRRR